MAEKMAEISDHDSSMPSNDPSDTASEQIAAELDKDIIASMTPEQIRFHLEAIDEIRLRADQSEATVKMLHDDYKKSDSWTNLKASIVVNCNCNCSCNTAAPRIPTRSWWTTLIRDKDDMTWALWLFMIGVIAANIIVLVSEGRKYGVWAQSNQISRAAYLCDWWFVSIPIPTPAHCWELFWGLFRGA